MENAFFAIRDDLLGVKQTETITVWEKLCLSCQFSSSFYPKHTFGNVSEFLAAQQAPCSNIPENRKK